MALGQCPKRGRDVSTEAASCTYCGVPAPAQRLLLVVCDHNEAASMQRPQRSGPIHKPIRGA